MKKGLRLNNVEIHLRIIVRTSALMKKGLRHVDDAHGLREGGPSALMKKGLRRRHQVDGVDQASRPNVRPDEEGIKTSPGSSRQLGRFGDLCVSLEHWRFGCFAPDEKGTTIGLQWR